MLTVLIYSINFIFSIRPLSLNFVFKFTTGLHLYIKFIAYAKYANVIKY